MDYCRSNGSAIYTRCNQSPKHLGNTGTIRNKPFGYCECLPLKNKRYFHQCFDFGNTIFSINLTRYAIIHFCCKSPLRHRQCFLRCFVYQQCFWSAKLPLITLVSMVGIFVSVSMPMVDFT